MTKKKKETLKLVESSNEETAEALWPEAPLYSEGFLDTIKEKEWEEVVEINTEEDLKGALTQEIAFALMRWWFPNRLPTGDDYKRWVEISMKDAEAVTEHLITKGIIRAEPNDN